MSTFKKIAVLAIALGGVSTAALADELIATKGSARGGVNTVALDLATSGEGVAFEFEVVIPKGATKVDTSGCLKGLPATHTGQCVYNEKLGRVIAIAFSPNNDKLPGGVMDLGTVSYTSLQKGGETATIQGLVVADGRGGTVQSNIRNEDALLEKTK